MWPRPDQVSPGSGPRYLIRALPCLPKRRLSLLGLRSSPQRSMSASFRSILERSSLDAFRNCHLDYVAPSQQAFKGCPNAAALTIEQPRPHHDASLMVLLLNG